MARIIDNQINLWGKQQGIDIQRSDLWVVDFNQALSGLASITGTSSLTKAIKSGTPMTAGLAIPYVPPKLASYFSSSVILPELKVKAESIRRDARPYQMPSWDEPLEAVRMTFLLDCFRSGGSQVDPYRSDIYQMLDVWRAVVRAGRGSMSSEFAITLDGNYRMDYAYDVRVLLLRGSSNPVIEPSFQGNLTTASAAPVPTANTPVASSVMNDLEFSMQFRLVNCWLGSFRLTDLNYDGAKAVQLETTFYADDIRQEAQQNQ